MGEIQRHRTLGIDLGIGSCGWAVIDQRDQSAGIVALGARTFDVPETDKERTPTNQLRRQFRGLRTVLRRRRQRMNELRRLFAAAGLIADDKKGALKISGLDPWRLRAEGLDRKLTGPEFAVALGHIAKHRGFKSNSKRDRGANAPNESSEMLRSIEATRLRLREFRTVGEMFAKDREFAKRKRNRDGDYTRSILREDHVREVRLLFDLQRQKGSALASADLERRFIEIAFHQNPLADSEDKVGLCPFERSEKRAARQSYSFELFRLLSRLAALRIRSGRTERPLTPAEIAAAAADFGSKKGMTFKRLRNDILQLGDGERFEGVPFDEEGKRDVVTRAGDMAAGTYALRQVLGDAFRSLSRTPDTLDRIAFVLSFREDIASIRKGLEDIGLEPPILSALVEGVEDGALSDFSRAGHISAKACRRIIPHLMHGLVYSEACAKAGYDHALRPATALDDIRNPVARKALTEAIKQVRAVVREYGVPERMHIELARDVGKGKDERDEIKFGIERRNKEKDRLRVEFEEAVGRAPRGAEDLLRFELWKEQKGRCLYTDREIPVRMIVASDNTVQVDHILPWSRSGDDSFTNKTLCYAAANQDKKRRTPFQWLGSDEGQWTAFAACVEGIKEMKGRKKRNYLLRDDSVLEEKFRPRNLNDTRYATRLLLDALKREYPGVEVAARPGPLTDRLRRAWGIQSLKKDAEGKRVDDDRHHALDALIVAATSQSELNRLTRAFQEAENIGAHRDFSRLDPPWPGFVAETREKLAQVFVSRAERRRARGEAHAATIRPVEWANGTKIVLERKPVEKLVLKDLERIKNPERNAALAASVKAWIESGKAKGTWPKSPKGDDIKKLTLVTRDRPAVAVLRGLPGDTPGSADRGEMVRVDVFRRRNSKGRIEHFVVPIYPHQVANGKCWPHAPDRAVQAHTNENEWPVIDDGFEFLFSLHPLCYLELTTAQGELIEGYFRELNRNDAGITLSKHYSRDAKSPKTGSRTLRSIRKFHVDRLGRRFEVAKETRTWRGAACI